MTFRGAPRVAVVVLNFNGLDDTIRCLQSLRPVADDGNMVVLVDNASDVDPGPAARDVLPTLVYERTARNLGYAGGNNVGIRRALELGSEYVLILNNDTIVAPSIVTDLLEVFGALSDVGIVGPVINFMDEPEVVMTDGVVFNPGPGAEFFRRIVVPLLPDPGAAKRVSIVNGCCMMIRADVLRAVGLFDERMFIVHEESDLCLRAARAGVGSAVASKVLVWHKGSSSFERSGRQVQRYFDARNLYYLLRRHAGKTPGSRGQVLSLINYFRYCFYRYDVEVEAGQAEAARAVANGVSDALAGVVGSADFGFRAAGGMAERAFRYGRLVRTWMRMVPGLGR